MENWQQITSFSFSPESHALYELNLETIQKFYPALYQILHESSGSSNYEILLAGESPAPACRLIPKVRNAPVRGDAGLIHGLHPWQEAKRTLQNTPILEYGLIFVLNCGLGYTARSIGQILSLENLKSSAWRRVIFVEEDIELFRLSLYLHNWTFLFTAPENLFIIGLPLSQVLQHPVLQTYPPMYLDKFIAISGGIFSRRETLESDNLLHILFSFKAKAETYIHRATEKIKNRKEFFYPAKKIKKILFMSSYMYPMQWFIMETLKSWGIECKLNSLLIEHQLGQHAFGFYRKWAWMDLLNTYQPDAIFLLTETCEAITADSRLGELPIPKIVWFLDDPLRTLRYRDMQGKVGKNYYLFCYDKTHLDALRRIGFRQVFHLPFGALFHPQLPGISYGEPFSGVAYVGTILGEQEILNSRIFTPYFPQLLPLLQQASKEISEGRWASEYDWLNAHGIPDPQIDLTIYVRYLQDTITNQKRIAYLTAAAEVGLQTYGKNILNSPLVPPAVQNCYQGKSLNYITELPGVYAKSAVNLNINHFQTKHAVPARIYDALAVKGFILSDANPAITEEFDVGREMVCFQSEEEIKDLSRFYIKNENERRKIAEAGHRVVMAQYTINHRLQKMFQIIQENWED